MLPEFFTTGIGFVEELADAALAPDGEATELLRALARRHGAIVGGSFLCRDADGEVRNAFFARDAGRRDRRAPRQGPADDVGERLLRRRRATTA